MVFITCGVVVAKVNTEEAWVVGLVGSPFCEKLCSLSKFLGRKGHVSELKCRLLFESAFKLKF